MRGITDRSTHINPWVLPLAILALTATLWLSAKIEMPWLAALATLNTLLCAGGIIRSISRGLRPVAGVFYIFTFAWLGVAPVFQIATHTVAWNDMAALYDSGRVATALVMNFLGSLAFLVGAEWSRSRAEKQQAERSQPLPAADIRPWVLAGIILASIALLPLAVQANGGLAALFTSRQDITGLRADLGNSIDVIGGPAYALTRILPGALAVAGALLSIYAIQRRWTSFMGVKVWHGLALCIAGGMLVLFSNPLAHSRFTAAAAFGSLFLALVRPRSTRWGFVFAGAMLTVTLLVYPLANAFRSQTFNVKTGVEAFTSADFDGFQQVINTLNYVSDMGHTWGGQTLSGIGFFVPRSIWEGKADPASFAIAEHAGYVFTNLSLPIHAEFYLEFGWVGVLVGMAGLGFIAGRLDHAWVNEPGTKLALIAPYIALATLGIIRGPIGAQAPVWAAVAALLMLGIARGKDPAPPAKPGFTSGSQPHARPAPLQAGL